MTGDFALRDFGNIGRLFPLPGVVLFPHAVMPLHIFEPRYRQMTEDALAGDRLITIVQARSPIDWTSADEPMIEEVACLGRILDHERLPDGRFNFLLLGLKRVRLLREISDATKLYRLAEVELIEDQDSDEPNGPRRDELAALFRAVAERDGPLDPDLAGPLESGLSLGMLTDIVAQALNLPAAVRQAFLAEPHVDRRADGLIAILRQLAQPAPPRPFPPPFSSN